MRNELKREIKINDQNIVKFSDVDDYLKTISKKFMKDTITIEKLDKAYVDIVSKTTIPESRVKYQSGVKPKSKKQEDRAIFHDIFIKPKENKIKELKNKRLEACKDTTLDEEGKPKIFISNKIKLEKKAETHEKSMNNTFTNIRNEELNKEKIVINKDSIAEVNLNSIIKNYNSDSENILKRFLNDKFIPQEGSSPYIFNYLIQIKPPEGINAVVASPLLESKGWAPAVPSVSIDKNTVKIGDLTVRAKYGIQISDTATELEIREHNIKESHMAFNLGSVNEDENRLEESLKFFKKYFLCAKKLEDVYGTELALNRISVVYSKLSDYEQSLYYNQKHKEISSFNVNSFVANYNCGLCLRIMKRFEEAIEYFTSALNLAEEENDEESCILCVCQLSICYIYLDNYASFQEYANVFYEKNKSYKDLEIELEMNMICGYVNSCINNPEEAKNHYQNALNYTRNEHHKAICLCNMGIIEANMELQDYLNSLI